MDQPNHLPASTGDLIDEWTVYADYLQTRGDARGELIAYELALPEVPEPPALRVFHGLANAACVYPQAIRAGISLGHARTLAILAGGVRRSRSSGPRDGTLAWARDFFLRPEAALLEELRFVYVAGENAKHWRRLLAVLPARCRRVHVAMVLPITDAQVDALVALLPEHAREVSVSWQNRWGATSIDPAMRFLQDRFDVVDVSQITASPSPIEGDVPAAADLARLCEALAATTRVCARIAVTRATRLPRRILIGRSEDAALTQESSRSVVTLPRWPLLALQQRYGILPIRTQLARRIAEGYSIGIGDGGIVRVGFQGGDLVRRGDRWTVRGDAERPLRRNDAPVASDAVEPLEDGDQLAFGSSERTWTFVARDVERVANATAR